MSGVVLPDPWPEFPGRRAELRPRGIRLPELHKSQAIEQSEGPLSPKILKEQLVFVTVMSQVLWPTHVTSILP